MPPLIFLLCFNIINIPIKLDIIPTTRNHGWYLAKKAANTEIPARGITCSKKWLQHAIMLPPEIVPVAATVPVSSAVCFIEKYNPICMPNPMASGNIRYHKLLRFEKANSIP